MIGKLPPFVFYYLEDKSKYPKASDLGYFDKDEDFLVGESGGFLFNVNFVYRRTHELRPAARYYEKYGVYTKHPIDSAPHRRFRIQEENRRKIGFTAKCKLLYKDQKLYDRLVKEGKEDEAYFLLKPLRITGEHYNFINYGTMQKLDESSVIVSKSGSVTGNKTEGVPIFFGAQYWWYKSKEFAKNNGYHLIAAKTRRAGFSYMEAIGSANNANLYPKSTVIHVASDSKYIIKARSLTNMTKMQLEHYEINTPFVRGFISVNIEGLKLGYKKKDNTDDGYQSQILSLTTGPTNSEVAIGKDAREIKCEELSTFPIFDAFMGVTEPTTRTGSITTGLITAWGTGGATEGDWALFERNFYSPKSHNFMPFENIWDKDSRNNVCGFFKPYIDSLQGFTDDGRASIDEDGNTNYEVAYEISVAERKKNKDNSKSISEHLLFCGQYANMPSESFNASSDNMFSSEKLTAHINKVKNNPDYKFYTDGIIEEITQDKVKFISNEKLFSEGKKIHEYIADVPHRPKIDRYGCTRIWHFPYIDPRTGKVPDIYTISYDPVGKSKDKDDITNKHSNNSATVWMNPNTYFNNVHKLRVANYYGRPPDLEDADRIVKNLGLLYGGHKGIILAETNRGETVSNFKKWNCKQMLDKEPTMVWDNKIKPSQITTIGMNLGNDIIKLKGLRLLKRMLYETVGKDDDGNDILFFETIPDLSFLLEVDKFKYDGNFDRVSDAIIEAFKHKKMELKAAKELEKNRLVEELNETIGQDLFERAWY